LGMRGRPNAPSVTFHNQMRATSQAMSWRATCMEETNYVHFHDICGTPDKMRGFVDSAALCSE